MLPESVQRARALFDSLTPLSSDCGRLCGGACCQSQEGETTGMLLFPGEEAYYADKPDYTLLPAALGQMLVCSGRCRREDRPLSCRIFPLLPVLRSDGIKVATDLRARMVCPLARQGKDALLPDFVEAVRSAGQMLAEDDDQRLFLEKLTAQQDEWKALQRSFRR